MTTTMTTKTTQEFPFSKTITFVFFFWVLATNGAETKRNRTSDVRNVLDRNAHSARVWPVSMKEKVLEEFPPWCCAVTVAAGCYCRQYAYVIQLKQTRNTYVEAFPILSALLFRCFIVHTYIKRNKTISKSSKLWWQHQKVGETRFLLEAIFRAIPIFLCFGRIDQISWKRGHFLFNTR